MLSWDEEVKPTVQSVGGLPIGRSVELPPAASVSAAPVRMLDDGAIEQARQQRYAGWAGERGQRILGGAVDLATLADEAVSSGLDPQPVSGRQEWLENQVNRVIWSTPS
jgi:xylose isomerase